jgi:hypothetical protein
VTGSRGRGESKVGYSKGRRGAELYDVEDEEGCRRVCMCMCICM